MPARCPDSLRRIGHRGAVRNPPRPGTLDEPRGRPSMSHAALRTDKDERHAA
jgi:hypothetical protein